MSSDDFLKDVPLHMMMVRPVYDADGLFLFYHAILRMSETERIIERGETEDKALAKLRQTYNDWLDEPSR